MYGAIATFFETAIELVTLFRPEIEKMIDDQRKLDQRLQQARDQSASLSKPARSSVDRKY